MLRNGVRLVVALMTALLPIASSAQQTVSSGISNGRPAAKTADLTSNTIHAGADGTDGAATSIELDVARTGRTFDGVGAISGGGGNSRLLIDYPAKQRNQILDYLFKPGYGASLQILKLEIGGDANSTDGSEPSVEHARGYVNCNAGYELWLAKQAKLRNPNIKLYARAWAAPGWIDHGDFWSQTTIDYLMTWLDCAHSHGLEIDYLGGWNERGFNEQWYENLHATLAARHPAIQIVGDDSDWKVATAMAKDPAFAKSIQIIGVHYSCDGGDGGNADSCHSTQDAIDLKKPLWDSESGSQDDNSGSGPLIRAIIRGYIDAKMTALLNWPLLAAITSNLPYPTTGLMVAAQPWSGSYSLGKSLWVTAQVTQFTQPGWQFLKDASGYVGNNRNNGSYISLRSPNGKDYSTIVETTTATAASKLTINLGAGFAGKTLSVWSTNDRAAGAEDQFIHGNDMHMDTTGKSEFKLRPGYVYTFSTLMTAGKGNATAPPAHPLGLPYRDDFKHYPTGSEARYFSDMQGAFEIEPCAAGRSGKCLQQMAAIKPIEWQDDSDAFTLIGDPSWTNYAASVDVELAKPGRVELIGRAGTQKRPQSHQQGYYYRIANTGAWTIFKSNSEGIHAVLASGSAAALGTGDWHRIGLSFKGHTIIASLDGRTLKVLTDNSYLSGQVGLGTTSYDTDQFDNLSIKPVKAAKP